MHRRFNVRIAKAVLATTSVFLFLNLAACEQKPASQKAADTIAKPVVYTTFYPTTYFTERIGGDHVQVLCPCPADEDPSAWMPDDGILAAYQGADLIVANGASFEHWLQHTILPEDKLLLTAKPLADNFITLEHELTHSHGPGGEHTHGRTDGHTWLDPNNARIQAQAIRDALIRDFPERRDAFEQGFDALSADLDTLDARLKTLSQKLGDQHLLANHPAYNYLARRYGWNVKNYHLEPEQLPSEEAVAEIESYLAKNPATIMLWESQPSLEVAEKFENVLSLQSVVFSPCEMLPSEAREAGKTYLTVMNQNVARLESALEEQ